MDVRVTMDKMPTFVKETVGEAQKRLTLFEGEARKVVTSTWQRLAEVSQWERVGQALANWRSRADEALQLERLRVRTQALGNQVQTLGNQVQTLGNQVSDRAFHTVGLVTQTDFHSLTRQIDRLRKDVRRLVRKSGNSRNRAKAKTA